ncbi:unnamed protein product, partial [Symbiodinium sp. CCMP2592]
AVQSLSTRATQDLWTAAPVPFLAGTAEQNLQRRTNLTNKLAKRLSGNERAKVDMAVALQAWFGFVSQHMLGLLAQVRAIGQRLDDDTAVAAREMREILSEQPSETTAAQVNKALAAVGPIWSEPQEQEVLQLAARLRAFGTVTMQPMGNVVANLRWRAATRSAACGGWCSFRSHKHDGVRLGAHLDVGSVASFGATDEDLLGLDGSGDPAIPILATELPGVSTMDVRAPAAMPPPLIPAGVDATALPVSTGGRWRKRSGGHTERPSKSPRREVDTGTPWPSLKTGRTPDKAPRSSLLAAVEDEAELIPAEREPPRTWEQAWTALLQFAVSQGGERVGELASCPEQDAIVCPVHNAEKESEVLTHCGAVLSATCPKAFSSQRMSFTAFSGVFWPSDGIWPVSAARGQPVFSTGFQHQCVTSGSLPRLWRTALRSADSGMELAPPGGNTAFTPTGAVRSYRAHPPVVPDPCAAIIRDAAVQQGIHVDVNNCLCRRRIASVAYGRVFHEPFAARSFAVLGQRRFFGEWALGFPFVFFQLGLDFCRLSDAGWSQFFRVPGLNREFKLSLCTGQLMHVPCDCLNALTLGLVAEFLAAKVMSIGGLTTWDLPGVEIHGQLAVWKWPGEVSSLAGECGHLFQEGHDAFACDATRGLQARINGVLNQPSVAAFASVVSPAVGRSLTTRSYLGWWFLLSFLLQGPVPVLGAASDTDDECPEPQVFPRYDSSPPVAVAWCYELSCQTTHLGVMPASLWGYCQANAPTDTIRFHIWTPFQGPAIFDYPKGGPLSGFNSLLWEAGHRPDSCGLHVAFDTQPTVLDVVSCPIGDPTWWIVRDGMSRELLRPVAPWYEPDGRRVLTLNSLGQAQGLSFGPEAGAMQRLPAGVRAAITYPFSRVLGHLSAGGLVLTEIAIGSFSRAISRRSSLLLGVLLGSLHVHPARAMQQDLILRTSSGQHQGHPPAWGLPRDPAPTICRIWTYTLAAPTVVPYVSTPDPGVMATYVANTARGVTATGDFVWTSPQIVHGVAHLLHVPSGSTASSIFWLLHYRGRAAVMSVPRAVFDWQHVGQTAAEEFGLPFFSQGQFGIWHGGRVIPFGSQLPAPGHGTIITLVRNLPVPAAGFSSWDAPSDAPASFHFDYDLCRGAGGELPLAGETCLQVLPSGMSQSPPTPAEAAGPSRTVNEISHQLTMLTSRLEVAGVLPGSEPDE